MTRTYRISEPDGQIEGTLSLQEFIDSVEPLEPQERHDLVEQAIVLLEGIYVHLRLKRAMHGIDPLQRLRLLQRRIPALSDAQFHVELAAIFRSLRDLHTVYHLPHPYRGHVATLGVMVERCYDEDGTALHVVTKVDPAVAVDGLAEDAEVVTWNGIPIERAVELNAERQAGSNAAARTARGLEALTFRPLRTSPPPDEHWVILGLGDGTEVRLPWRIAPTRSAAGRAQDPVSTISAVLGIDAGNEATRQIKRRLFAPGPASAAGPQDMAAVMYADTLEIGGGRYGYLRLFSFNVAGARAFLEALAAALAGLPEDGLVVDIRGNPGGHIPAAEGALQLLTDRPVEPARFSLSTTPMALDLCDSNPGFRRWAASISAAVETGEAYSQPLPLSDPAELTEGLPAYPGPKVLVTDALCYSAADIFAAGFQDNELGPILGTASHTGAGGANVWTHDLLRLWLGDTLAPLPAGTSFRVALRRVTRVREKVGVPLEDLGVAADRVHPLTRRDLTDGNPDLQAAAVELMLAPPSDDL